MEINVKHNITLIEQFPLFKDVYALFTRIFKYVTLCGLAKGIVQEWLSQGFWDVEIIQLGPM